MIILWRTAVLLLLIGLLPTSVTGRSVRLNDFSEAEIADLRKVHDPEKTIIYINKGFSAEGLSKLTEFGWIQEIRMNISETDNVDLTPLGQLSELRKVEIRGNSDQLTPLDISPLSGLVHLAEINILYHKISGGDKTIRLPALRRLRLQHLEIDSIFFLGGAPHLHYLDLGATEIGDKDLAALSGLQHLRSLDISGSDALQDSDLRAVAKIPMLFRINLSNCSNLRSLDFLAEQTELEVIDAYRCRRLESADALTDKRKLAELRLAQTAVSDFNFLKTCIVLSDLDLDDTEFADTSILEPLRWLRKVRLSRTKVTDLNGLRNKVGLEQISVYDTRVNDLEPLVSSVHLEDVNVRNTPVTSLAPLMHSNRLDSIVVSEKIEQSEIERLERRFPDLRVSLP